MIRKAITADIPALNNLLEQVLQVHAQGRPDIFKSSGAKYSNEKLQDILKNPNTPIFVAEDTNGQVVGYAFCQYRAIKDSAFIRDVKYCYLDDLCVDINHRAQGIGTQLYNYVKEQALKDGYPSVRLNVWCLNGTAIRFYEKLGLTPLSMIMEQKL